MFLQMINKAINLFFPEPEIKQPVKIRKEIPMKTFKEVKWDIKKIKAAIREVSAEIKALKGTIRRPNVNITWEQQCELTNLKERATLLCVLRAANRKKVHLVTSKKYLLNDLDLQEDWLDGDLKYLRSEFEKAEEAPVTPTS